MVKANSGFFGYLFQVRNDHLGSMQRLINEAELDKVSYETLVKYMCDPSDYLAPDLTTI